MANQFAYAGMQPPTQAAGYPFHYPTASGDQSAQLLQGYGMPQQGGANPPGIPNAMFGAQSAAPYSYDQANSGYSQSPSVPVCQVGAGSQVQMQPGGFAYPDFSSSYAQYASMAQNVPPGLTAMQAGMGTDMQQFAPLLTNAFGLPMSANGAILEALAQEQGLTGYNPMAFLQDPTGAASRSGTTRGGQRGGFNKFGGRTNSNLPSVTNPDGLRDDTVFVSNLPQTIDHETMKAQFGVIGKIKINAKSGMPMVWIFKEKGIPKGEALVTYEDPQCVQAAIKYFSEHEFLGRKIEVKQAVNSQRPVIVSPGGNAATAGGSITESITGSTSFLTALMTASTGESTLSGPVVNSSTTNTTLNNYTGATASGQYDGTGRGGSTAGSRGGRASSSISNGRSGTGSNQAGSREGDWSCAQCGNINFSWREQCNRCQVPRFQDGSGPGEMPGLGRGIMPRPGGQSNIPVPGVQSNTAFAGFGRGGPMVTPGVPTVAARAGASAVGRGGGPMRGSSVGVGRARPAPY